MANGHNNVKRIVRRVGEELRATRAIAAETTWPEALNTLRAKLDIQIMSRNGFKEPPAVRARLMRKHETLLKYMESRFGDFYNSYDYDGALPPSDPLLEGKVWMCWWQGEDKAPEIVRACIDSVRKNAGGHEVVVITDENVHQYVHIPKWVFDKVSDGVMSRTHLSDLLRLSLLAEHGGLWLDATFFCMGSLDQYMRMPLWTIKRPGYLHASVAGGMFANYSLGCDSLNRRIFATVRDFYLNYWEQADFLIDYLLTDYLIVMVQRYDSGTAEAFALVEPNNPRCDDLQDLLNESFSQEVWNELCYKTRLFKLTWKQAFRKVVAGGEKTFYGALLDGNLSFNGSGAVNVGVSTRIQGCKYE